MAIARVTIGNNVRRAVFKDPYPQKQLLRDLLALEFPKNRSAFTIIISDERIDTETNLPKVCKRPQIPSLFHLTKIILDDISKGLEQSEQLEIEKNNIDLIISHLQCYLPYATEILNNARDSFCKIISEFIELEEAFSQDKPIGYKLQKLQYFFTEERTSYFENLKKNSVEKVLKKYTSEIRLKLAQQKRIEWIEKLIQTCNSLLIPNSNDASVNELSYLRRSWQYLKSFVV